MLAGDAFQTKAARVLEQGDGFSVYCFRQPDRAVLILQVIFEQMPARSIFDTTQIMPIEVEQIECVEDSIRGTIARGFAGSTKRLLKQPQMKRVALPTA